MVIAGLEHAIDLSASSGEADSENTGDDSDSDEVSIADLVGNFSDGLKLEHAFPVFYNDLHDSGGEQPGLPKWKMCVTSAQSLHDLGTSCLQKSKMLKVEDCGLEPTGKFAGLLHACAVMAVML